MRAVASIEPLVDKLELANVWLVEVSSDLRSWSTIKTDIDKED